MTHSVSDDTPVGRGMGVLVGLVLFSLVFLFSATVATATHEPILYGTDSGLDVTDASGGSPPSGTPFPGDETVALPGINVSAAGETAVTVETRNGTMTNLSAIDTRHPITVAPDDKNAVVLLAGVDRLNFSAVDYVSQNTDFTYAASEQARLRLNSTGLPDGSRVDAIDVDTGTKLGRATVATNGSVTFAGLPTGTHDVTVYDISGRDGGTLDDTTPRSVSAAIFAESYFITPGTTVRFDGTQSRPQGIITSYTWDFDGDEISDATGLRTSRTFAEPGRYPVTLGVQSAQSTSDATDTVTVRVRNGTTEPPRSGASATPRLVPSARDLHFSGDAELTRLGVRISNPLAAAQEIRVHDIEVVGRDSDRFSIVSSDHGAYTLSPGQSQRIAVRTTARGNEPQHAQLRIQSDAANPQLDIWLTTTPTVVLVEESKPTTANASISVAARNIDRDSRLSVDVAPSRRTAAAIKRLDLIVRPAVDFEMNLTHATDPKTLSTEPFAAPNRVVLQYIRLTHTLPNEGFDETAVVYRVEKDAIPPETNPAEIVFRQYEDSEWTELVSSLQQETERHYVYRVETDGFSQFLVTAPTAAVAGQATTGSADAVDYLLAGLLVLGMVGSGVFVLRSRRNQRGEDTLK